MSITILRGNALALPLAENCDWPRGRLLSRLAADRHGLDHYQRAHGGRR